jgi:hypothetical protein
MNLKVVPVNPNYIHQIWPFVEKNVQDTFTQGHDFPEWSLDYSPAHIRQLLISGQWVLFVALDEEAKIHGSCTVSFINYPLHRVAFVTTYGGKFLSNDNVMTQFKNLLKSYGATKAQAYCRDSMVRLLKRFEFEPRNTLVEVKL